MHIGDNGTDAPENPTGLPKSNEPGDSWYRDIYHFAPTGMLVFRDGRCVDVNPAFCRLVGFTREELIGRHTDALIPPEYLPQRDAARAMLREHGHWHGELPLKTADGGLIHLEWNISGKMGNGLRLAVVTDVTERRSAEEALALSEVRARAILNTLNEGVLVLDAQGRVLDSNPAAGRIAGLSPEEVQAKADEYPTLFVAHSMDGELLPFEKWPLSRLARGETFDGLRVRSARTDTGHSFVADHTGETVYSETGLPLLRVLTVRDITQEQIIEEALRASEARYRTAFDNIPDVVVIYDRDLRIQYINAATTRITGLMPSDFIGKLETEIFPEEIVNQWHPHLRQALETGRLVQLPLSFAGPAGANHLDLAIVPLVNEKGEVAEVVGISHDITERTRVEQELRSERQFLQSLLDNTPSCVAVLNWPSLRFVMVNPAYQAIVGETTPLVGRTYGEVFADSVERGVYEIWAKVIETGTPVTITDYETPIPGKAQSWWDSHNLPLRNEQGVVDSILVITWETTEAVLARKQLEVAAEAVKESERRFRQVVESLPQLVWTCLPDGSCDYASPQWSRYTGRKSEEQLGYGWLEQIHPEDAAMVEQAWRDATQSAGDYSLEFRIRRHDGAYRWFHTMAVPLIGEDGRIMKWFGSNTDITERKRQEQEITALNERLQRAMTETHHRVKNNLQVIAAMVDMQVLTEEPTVSMDELKRLSEHVRTLALVHDLLTQSAKAHGDASSVSVADLLSRLLPLLHSAFVNRPMDVALTDVALPPRQASSLALVVSELVGNAFKHGEGRVQVSLQSGAEGVLEVSDEGPGFPLGLHATMAANTGLELVNHLSRWDFGGSVTFENRQPNGATVRVQFPIPAVGGAARG